MYESHIRNQWAVKWTPDQEMALKRHIADHMTFAEAADAINAEFGTAHTRSAVTGKAMRIGLKSLNAPKVRPRRHKPAAARKPKSEPSPTLAPAAEPIRCELVPLNVPLIELEAGMCRYPFGDSDFVFCGLTAEGSYCPDHQGFIRRRRQHE
jgi:hypothetical protein